MVYLYFTFAGKILGHLYLFFTLPLFHFTFFPQLPNIYLYFALPLFLLPLFPYTLNILDMIYIKTVHWTGVAKDLDQFKTIYAKI